MTLQKIPGIYAIPPYPGWSNQQLTKNCGIVPYLFHKKYGFRAVMAGCKIEDSYPYLDTYVPGLEMDFLPDDHATTRLQYIHDHAGNIDILCLHGPYTSYLPLVRLYRKLRPDGRIYMELDPSSAWMDRLLWDTPDFRELLDSCTVIGASCKKMQRHLSRKWPYIIEYLPNGWYNYTDQETTVDFRQKENIILTVGRIGTYPKQNHILLNAFASIKDQLPDWTLKLVGPINETFTPFIEEFFQHNPDLNKRVIFTGAINDKEKRGFGHDCG